MARTTAITTKSIDLDETRRRINRWRETRPHGHAPMPFVLWNAAVAAARRHCLYTTARTLRVDYGALKKHLEAASSPAERRGSTTFVEFAPANGPVPAVDTVACVIEVVTPRATRRIRLSGLTASDLLALAQMAWGTAL